MYALNRIKLIGYVTEKPELRTIGSGMEVCDVNLRVISKVQRESDTFDSTSFHSVTCWAGMAKTISQYTDAGSQIYIEGRLKTETWDGEDGKKRYKTKVIGDDMILLTPQNGGYPAVNSSTFATGINEVELVGNLVKDIEVRQTPSGQTVGSTAVATNRKWKNRQTNEMQEETEFHNIVIWNALASEGEAELKKGRKVFIKGRVQTRSWDSPEGEKRYTTEVIAESIALLGSEAPVEMKSTPSQSTAPVAAAAPAANNTAPAPTAEEIPEIPSIQYESNIKPEDLPF